MKSVNAQLARAMDLLGEIRSQDFIGEIAWDSKEMRRWIRKTDKLLDSLGYMNTELAEGSTKS